MKNIKERPTYLCGGVVFFLLTYSSYPNPATKELLTRSSGDHSDFQIMVDLLNAVFNKEMELPIESLHTQISRYKACKTLKCSVLPFDSSPLCNAYKDISDEDYQEIVEKVDYLVSTHVDIDMKEKFVKLLLHIIKNDSEIDDSELFYVTADRKPTTKTELLHMTEFTLSYFLVGILHYVFTYRTVTDNKKQEDEILRKGQETLDILASKNNSYSPRDINDLIPIYEAYTIKVIVRDPQHILDSFWRAKEDFADYTMPKEFLKDLKSITQ